MANMLEAMGHPIVGVEYEKPLAQPPIRVEYRKGHVEGMGRLIDGLSGPETVIRRVHLDPIPEGAKVTTLYLAPPR